MQNEPFEILQYYAKSTVPYKCQNVAQLSGVGWTRKQTYKDPLFSWFAVNVANVLLLKVYGIVGFSRLQDCNCTPPVCRDVSAPPSLKFHQLKLTYETATCTFLAVLGYRICLC